jgi:hypothetical protein
MHSGAIASPCIGQENGLALLARWLGGMNIFKQKWVLLLGSLLLSMTVIGMIPRTRVRHFRPSCGQSHAGAAAMQRFTCDISSASKLVVSASTYDVRALGYVVATADFRNVRPLRTSRTADPPLRRLTRRLKLASSQADSQDPLV